MRQFFIMNSNLENEKSVTAGKMYPIDLAPQKITIVKSLPNTEVKIPHLIPGQPKNSTPGQIISHPGSMGLMRPTAQIISSGASSQAQMIVSGSPLLQGTQIVTQGSQIIGQGSQIISTSQLINTSSQLLSPTTQIISQGTQLTNAGSTGNNSSNNITGTTQTSVVSTVSGNSQTVNAGGQLIGAPSGLVVSSSVRTLPQNVRVLPPTGHNPRPVLSNMNLGSTGINSMNSVVVSKPVVSHVPRGPAAGASLAVPRIARPAAPISTPVPTSGTGAALPISSLGVSGAWNSGTRGNVRGAVVYSARATVPRALARVPPPVPASATVPAAMPSSASTSNPVPVPAPAHSIALPATTVLTPSSVIASTVRGVTPRALTPTPAQPAPATPASRPIPLLQRNYHTTKVVGVAGGTVRTPVGNSAPSQLYYEVPRPPAPHSAPPAPTPRAPSPASALPLAPVAAHPPQQPASTIRTLSAYNHQPTNSQILPPSTVQVIPEARLPLTSVSAALVPRPSILRKREIDGSPTKTACVGPPGLNAYELVALNREPSCPSQWDREDTERDGSGGGSTTVSAASSPEPDDEPLSPPRPATPQDISPRKKPRKQILSNDVRQCDFPVEEPPPTPPPPPTHQPKRPLLSSSFVCGWRATALHFTRPSDVRRREPRAKDIVAIANQPHALTSANGWKVHHLTAQMDDLVSLESDVGSQLSNVLRALESAHNKAQAAIAPHSHALLELIKGNIQRSKIVCEGIQEAREDILRVFTHQTVVADILTRQADKRCFRKHRTQS